MNKKAFTLIELLAVLVVLAILVLIAIPIVISIINNARENSYKRSIEVYGRAVENAVGEYLLDHDVSYSSIESKYDSDHQKIGDVAINYSGQTVKCENLLLTENGIITLKGCIVDGSDKLYKYSNKKVSLDEYKEYSIGDTFELYGASYHIIADSDKKQDYVVALKDAPLTVAEAPEGGVNSYNINGYRVSAYYTSETCRYNNGTWVYTGCKVDYEQSTIKTKIDNWANTIFTGGELKKVNGNSSRLITYDEYRNIPDTYNWRYLENFWYWTMSAGNNNGLLIILNDGVMSNSMPPCGTASYNKNVLRYGVIRPVINVYKSSIE